MYIFLQPFFFPPLVIFAHHFIETLRMLASWALFWRFFTFMHITAIPAFPSYDLIFLENFVVLNILQKFSVPFFMILFYFCDFFKRICNVTESLFPCSFV